MRIRTDVLTPLGAALVLCFIAFLPSSQSQTNANALHNEISKYIQYDYARLNYDYSRVDRASRSSIRADLSASKSVPLRTKALKTGYKYVGVRYCRGGSSPHCFDCSGFIQYVYKKNGISMPRTTASQLNQARIIKKKYAKAGDLVFFYNSKRHIYHVGIYVGHGKVLHSPKPGRKVRVEKIWTKRIIFGRIS